GLLIVRRRLARSLVLANLFEVAPQVLQLVVARDMLAVRIDQPDELGIVGPLFLDGLSQEVEEAIEPVVGKAGSREEGPELGQWGRSRGARRGRETEGGGSRGRHDRGSIAGLDRVAIPVAEAGRFGITSPPP